MAAGKSRPPTFVHVSRWFTGVAESSGSTSGGKPDSEANPAAGAQVDGGYLRREMDVGFSRDSGITRIS